MSCFFQKGVRNKTNITFKTPGGLLFAVEKYRNSLLDVCEERNINIDYFKNLIAIDPAKKEATFEFVNDENEIKKKEVLPVSLMNNCFQVSN